MKICDPLWLIGPCRKYGQRWAGEWTCKSMKSNQSTDRKHQPIGVITAHAFCEYTPTFGKSFIKGTSGSLRNQSYDNSSAGTEPMTPSSWNICATRCAKLAGGCWMFHPTAVRWPIGCIDESRHRGTINDTFIDFSLCSAASHLYSDAVKHLIWRNFGVRESQRIALLMRHSSVGV